MRYSWNTPLFPSAHEEGVLYCASQYAMRSEDRGDTWDRISDDLTGGGGAITSLVESSIDPKRLVAGAGQGLVSLTSDGGETWRVAGSGLPSIKLQRVTTSPHDAERVYVCLSGQGVGDHRPYLYRSNDFGETWEDSAQGLPNAPVNVVVEDPAVVGLIYLGSDQGVYASQDGGESWSSLSSGFPTAPVVDLAVHSDSATLIAVTHGLSAFALDVASFR